MQGIIATSNLKAAAVVGVAAVLAYRFTASKGKVINVAATVAACAIALPFATKL